MTHPNTTVIGITLGDPAGIGPEVIAKTLRTFPVPRGVDIRVIGDACVLDPFRIPQKNAWGLIDAGALKEKDIRPGKPNRKSAKASLEYLRLAAALLKEKQIHALVTAPVSKEGINGLGVRFHGHTEFLAEAFGVKKYEMMFVAPDMRVIILTRHIPLKDVSKEITSSKVYQALRLGNDTLRDLFGIKNPRIAVCGINPHAGEGGLLGTEERTKVIPAVRKAVRQGMKVTGPLAADTLFVHAQDHDLILAMYHDQGLTPIKTLYFRDVVNLTVGLPFIRTSPAHGTAFDIAGKGKADPLSLCRALELAIRLCKRRA